MRIRGFEKLTDIRAFSLVKKEGEHSALTFTARTSTEIALTFLSQEGDAITVSRDDGSTLFHGLIREVSISESHHGASVTVHANSFSILADEESRTRIFQTPQQTLSDILEKIPWNKAKCELNVAEAADKKPSGLVVATETTNSVVQNEETDFAFLRRMSHAVGFRLFVTDTMSGSNILAIVKHQNARKVRATDIINLIRKRHNEKLGLQLRLKPTTELDTGNVAQVEGVPGSFVVVTKSIVKLRETFVFSYELESADDINFSKKGDFQGRGKIFTGTITSVEDPLRKGRVQVAFDEGDFAKSSEERLWIPWRTPFGNNGGIVFLPDKGDHVEILFAGNSFVASTSFRTERLFDECSKPAEKYIGNNRQQRILLKENSLELRSAETQLIMDSEKIELAIGKTRIKLEKDRIFFETPENIAELSPDGIKLKTDKNLAVQSSKNFSLKADGSINTQSGNEFTLQVEGSGKFKSSGKLILNGSTVEIS